jgi:hypothetical protein
MLAYGMRPYAWQHGGAISVESDGIADQFTVVLSGCSGCNNTDSDGKALEFGYLSTSRGVTHRSLTDGAQSARRMAVHRILHQSATCLNGDWLHACSQRNCSSWLNVALRTFSC